MKFSLVSTVLVLTGSMASASWYDWIPKPVIPGTDDIRDAMPDAVAAHLFRLMANETTTAGMDESTTVLSPASENGTTIATSTVIADKKAWDNMVNGSTAATTLAGKDDIANARASKQDEDLFKVASSSPSSVGTTTIDTLSPFVDVDASFPGDKKASDRNSSSSTSGRSSNTQSEAASAVQDDISRAMFDHEVEEILKANSTSPSNSTNYRTSTRSSQVPTTVSPAVPVAAQSGSVALYSAALLCLSSAIVTLIFAC